MGLSGLNPEISQGIGIPDDKNLRVKNRKPAQSEGLIVENTSSGLVIYNQRTHQVHSLNQTSSLIFQACDGTLEVEQIAEKLVDLPTEARLSVTELTLNELRDLDLVRIEDLASSDVTRRELLKLVPGLAACLPAALTVLVPAPATAQSGCFVGSKTREEVCMDCGSFCPGTDVMIESFLNPTCSGVPSGAFLANCPAGVCTGFPLIGAGNSFRCV